MSHFNIAKKKSTNRSTLKSGDKVIVFCCGTGLDFSKNMLEEAKKLIDKKEWKNNTKLKIIPGFRLIEILKF